MIEGLQVVPPEVEDGIRAMNRRGAILLAVMSAPIFRLYTLVGVLARRSFTPDGLQAYVVLGVLAGIAVAANGAWTFTHSSPRIIGFLRELSPDIRDVVLDRRIGYFASLHSGLLLSRPPGRGLGFAFMCFADTKDVPLLMPAARVLQLVRSYGRKLFRPSVNRTVGIPDLDTRLKELQKNLRSASARLTIYRFPLLKSDDPAYFAAVLFADARWWSRARLVRNNGDAISGYIKKRLSEVAQA